MRTRLSVLTLLLWALPAWTQPHLAVKARTAVDDLRASSDGQRVRVTGVLRDNLGQPVAQVELRVGVAGAQVATRTGPDGRFEALLEVVGEGVAQIEVSFPGNPLLSQANSSAPVKVGRREVQLDIALAASLEAGEPATASVRAVDADGAAAELMLQARVDATPLPPLRLGPAGTAALALPALEPGVHTLRVYWPGDAHRLPAEAEQAFEVGRTLGVSLEVADAAPAPGLPVVLTGAVVGPDQAVSVRLLVNGQPQDERRSDADGRFRFVVEADALRPGPSTFRVAARTDVEGWRDGMSAPVVVILPTPPPPSPWWLWSPAILAGIALLGLLGRAWWKRPRPQVRPLKPVAVPPPPFVFEAPPNGVPGRLEVDVYDALTGAALDATVVWLAAGTPMPGPAEATPPAGQQAQTEAGHAVLLGGGDRLWAWAAEHAPACHPVPTRGGRARVGLLPIRARLQTLYDEVLVQSGRPPLRFGRQTPREAAPVLATRGAPLDALTALTELVERACFGDGPVTHALLVEAHALADQVRAGLARPSEPG